jgi:hypothetical protein
MDPDSGGDFTSSAIFKTTVVTVAFSSLYLFKTYKSTVSFKPVMMKPDTVVVKKHRCQQHP